uniref:Ku domain-containing protein n=1 Tax=Anopheles dirus TaxID=7168 RepID=A0A182NAS9_9DIPT
MARASGKAHMIVLDVGRSSSIATGTDKETFFEKSKTCVSLLIQRMIFSAPNDQVGMVLFGTPETNNQLNVELGGYENICEAFELKPANWQTLRILENQVSRSDAEVNWLDALIVATNFLRNGALGKKFTEHSIVLISPMFLRADVDEGQLETVTDAISAMCGVLHVITNHVQHSAASVGPIFTSSGAFDSCIQPATRTASRCHNERLVMDVFKRLNEGTVSNINWAVRTLAFVDPKAVRPMPWNSTLTIGTKLKLSISAFVQISEQKGLGSFKVDNIDGSATRVEMKTEHFLNDKKIDLLMQDVIVGYMYGSTPVPFDSTIDIEYRSGESRLACLGFTASSNILEEHLSGHGAHVVVAKKGCSASNKKLCALIKAMHELDVAMIATKVYRKDTKPRLNALLPTYKNEVPCFVMMELIFKDELCSLKFPALLRTKHKPKDEQYEAVGKLIDSMSLMDAIEDSSGECREAFGLHSTYNPTLQHVYRTVAHRALNPKQSLPLADSALRELMEVPKPLAERSKPAVEQVKNLFELKEIQSKTRTEWLQRVAKISAGTVTNSQSSISTIDSGIFQEDDGDNGSGTRRKVVSVGTVTPSEDFALLLRRGEKFATVATQLQNAVFELLFTSMRPPGDKVVAALVVYRGEAIKLGPYRYNEWIAEFKETLLARRKEQFWERVIVGERLGLIGAHESDMSTVSEEQAASFYKVPAESKGAEENSGGDFIDPDFLLDELNGTF